MASTKVRHVETVHEGSGNPLLGEGGIFCVISCDPMMLHIISSAVDLVEDFTTCKLIIDTSILRLLAVEQV